MCNAIFKFLKTSTPFSLLNKTYKTNKLHIPAK